MQDAKLLRCFLKAANEINNYKFRTYGIFMTTTNPYQAPASDVAQTSINQTYQPKILAASGRIGRLRYLAYSFASYLPIVVLGIIAALIMPGMTDDISEEQGAPLLLGIVGLLSLIVYIGMIIYMIILGKRRFNDMGHSGWMVLTFLIPVVNIFIGFWLLFGSGNNGPNRFGPAPNKNPISVVICGVITPIFFLIAFIGIFAAVAIPAYSDYQERAAAQYLSE